MNDPVLVTVFYTKDVDVFSVQMSAAEAIMASAFRELTDSIKVFNEYVDHKGGSSSGSPMVYTAVAKSVSSAFDILNKNDATLNQILFLANAYKMVARVHLLGMSKGFTRKKIKTFRKAVIKQCAEKSKAHTLFVEENVDILLGV